MIGFKIPGKDFLQLSSNSSLQGTINNPLFNVDEELGLVTFSQQASKSKLNKRLLGFPGLLSVRNYSREAKDCELWLGKSLQLFRAGKLNVLEANEKSYKINFQSDAGAIAAVKDDLLSDLPLGFDNLTFDIKQPFPVDNYALFPVKNPGFYGDKNTEFCNYINYYNDGFGSNTTHNGHAIVPFPYLAYILKKVFTHYGYQVKGDWIDAPETQRLVIFNMHALDQLQNGINVYTTAIDFRNHVPRMKVADFLKALRKMLGLAYVFDTRAREVKIVRLKDVLHDAAYDNWTKFAHRNYDWKANETKGFTLEQKGDQTLTYRIGPGKEMISTECSTLPMQLDTDELDVQRQWLLPVIDKAGRSLAFGLENDFGFQLLSYRGMQNDTEMGQYPLGTSGTADSNNLEVGNEALVWGGNKGLYNQAYKSWLEFLSEAETVTRPVQLPLAKLMMLDPLKKVWVRSPEGYVKAFWKSIDFTVDHSSGIKASKVTFYKTFK